MVVALNELEVTLLNIVLAQSDVSYEAAKALMEQHDQEAIKHRLETIRCSLATSLSKINEQLREED